MLRTEYVFYEFDFVVCFTLRSPAADEVSYLAKIHTMGNQISLSSFDKFLQKSVTVSAVLVMSTGSCTITRATANISSLTPVDENGVRC